MAISYPVIGQWYSMPDGALFEVVALDTVDNSIEIQYFDGTVEELEADDWTELWIKKASAPEDWSGSVDIGREDYVHDDDVLLANNWSDPLEIIDRAE
jgi:hypothetical protein